MDRNPDHRRHGVFRSARRRLEAYGRARQEISTSLSLDRIINIATDGRPCFPVRACGQRGPGDRHSRKKIAAANVTRMTPLREKGRIRVVHQRAAQAAKKTLSSWTKHTADHRNVCQSTPLKEWTALPPLPVPYAL